MRKKPLLLALSCLFLIQLVGKAAEMLDAVDSDIYWHLAEIEKKPEAILPLLDVAAESELDATVVDKHVAGLGSPDFAVRKKSMAELLKLGFRAQPFLEKALKSDNPEVVIAVRQVISNLGRTANDSQMHRLMAIRTLGELKAKQAIPALEKLAESEEPYVSEYVDRALREILGKEFRPRQFGDGALRKDLQITFPELSGLLHAKLPERKSEVNIRQAIDEAAALAAKFKIAGAPAITREEIDKVLREMTGELIAIYRRVGNVRIDSVTATVLFGDELIGNDLIVAVRGKYDRERLRRYLRSLDGGKCVEIKIGGFEWLTDGRNIFVRLPSDSLAVLVTGNRADETVKWLGPKIAKEAVAPAAVGHIASLLGHLPDDVPLALRSLPTSI